MLPFTCLNFKLKGAPDYPDIRIDKPNICCSPSRKGNWGGRKKREGGGEEGGRSKSGTQMKRRWNWCLQSNSLPVKELGGGKKVMNMQ